ncbi:MAG: hypothetical protein RL769_66 [Pseudomonadota bacterium]|jgi:AAA15 family ATPase/GTPase
MVHKKTKKISKPLLKNLSIKNFRCFENFHLKNLKRVNIFVGDNNSGKSSVLEAVGMLYPRLEDHFRILGARGFGLVFNNLKAFGRTTSFRIAILDFCSFFFKKNTKNSIEIFSEFSEAKKNVNLQISTSSKIEKFNEENEKLEPQTPQEKNVNPESIVFDYKFNNSKTAQRLGFSSLGTYDSVLKDFNQYNVIFLADQTPTQREIIDKWSKLKELANLKESNEIDERYLKILQNFEKDLKKIELIGSSVFAFRKSDFAVLLEDMGNGFKKFFDILLTIDLASKKNLPTLLCIDEIDNGLYYDKQDVFWEQIIKLCEEYNIQLFTTTHSYDCLKNISKIALKDEYEDLFQIVRLEKFDGKILQTTISQEELEAMIDNHYEIR